VFRPFHWQCRVFRLTDPADAGSLWQRSRRISLANIAIRVGVLSFFARPAQRIPSDSILSLHDHHLAIAAAEVRTCMHGSAVGAEGVVHVDALWGRTYTIANLPTKAPAFKASF